MRLTGVDKRAGMGAMALLCLALTGVSASAQGAAAPNPAPAAQAKPGSSGAVAAKRRKRTHPAKADVQPEVVTPTPVETPPPPDWPVNDKAAPAAVDWNGRVLSISATNSSLQQILADISNATGLKVEGAAADQRIYGSYGPAPARDVLSELLDGSGYNVLMIGDQGQGTPRTLVLTVKGSAPAPHPGVSGQGKQPSDEDVEEPEQPEQPDPNMHRPPGIQPMQPGQNRTPQEIMQEIEQRRLQMQQLQGAPAAPQANPTQPNNE